MGGWLHSVPAGDGIAGTEWAGVIEIPVAGAWTPGVRDDHARAVGAVGLGLGDSREERQERHGQLEPGQCCDFGPHCRVLVIECMKSSIFD